MNRTPTMRLLTVVVIMLLFLGACGDDDVRTDDTRVDDGATSEVEYDVSYSDRGWAFTEVDHEAIDWAREQWPALRQWRSTALIDAVDEYCSRLEAYENIHSRLRAWDVRALFTNLFGWFPGIDKEQFVEFIAYGGGRECSQLSWRAYRALKQGTT